MYCANAALRSPAAILKSRVCATAAEARAKAQTPPASMDLAKRTRIIGSPLRLSVAVGRLRRSARNNPVRSSVRNKKCVAFVIHSQPESLSQQTGKSFDIGGFESTADADLADILIAENQLLAVVSVELVGDFRQCRLVEHQRAVTPAELIGDSSRGLRWHQSRFPSGDHRVARGHGHRWRQGWPFHGIDLHTPLLHRHFHFNDDAEHRELRT